MDLPAEAHIYGKKSQPDQFGARALVSSWDEAAQQKVVARERDFTKMNKMCVQQKIVGKNVVAFRQENTNLMKPRIITDKKPLAVELN